MNIQPAKKNATYQDLCDLPDHMVGEIVDGELYVHPRPAPKHLSAAFSLGNRIGDPFQEGIGGPGGWVFYPEPELHIGIQVVIPDLAGWRVDNLAVYPNTAYFEVPPDWVCEILSPSTSKFDRGPKRRIYGEAEVKYMWIIDPDTLFLEAFAFRDGNWVLLGTAGMGEQVSFAPFDAISFGFERLFPLEPKPETEQSSKP